MTAAVALMVVAITLALVAIGVTLWRATLRQRERQRIAAQTLMAEWQLRTMTRAAMQRMLDTAREHVAGQGNR